MVVIPHFQQLIDSLDKNKLLTLPNRKEKAIKIEFSTTCGDQIINNVSDPPLPFAASDIFLASIENCRLLIASVDSFKSVYEVAFNIEGSNFDFQPGDTIGIIPHNKESEVDEIINHLGLIEVVDLDYTLSLDCGQKVAKIPPYIPVKSTLRHILTSCVDIRGIVKKLFLLALSQYTRDEYEKWVLEYLCSKEGSSEYTSHILNKNIGILDLFKSFKSCKPPVEVLLENLPRLLPRPYSIVNSRHNIPNVIKICFSVMDIGNNRNGLVTGHLEEIILQSQNIENKMKNLSLSSGNTKIPIYIRKNLNEFRLPYNTEIPLILIGPGTGVSPYVGFLEERQHLKKYYPDKKFGYLWLFFGCRNPEHDFIYKDELNRFVKNGVVDKLSTAFSRHENAEFRYVQDAILHNGVEVTKLIMQGARVYVCGDVKTIATQVKDVIIQCVVKYGNKNMQEAKDFICMMQKEKRYVNDIWN